MRCGLERKPVLFVFLSEFFVMFGCVKMRRLTTLKRMHPWWKGTFEQMPICPFAQLVLIAATPSILDHVGVVDVNALGAERIHDEKAK